MAQNEAAGASSPFKDHSAVSRKCPDRQNPAVGRQQSDKSGDKGAVPGDGFGRVIPSVKRVVIFDMFEGHNSWDIGYDGPGCVSGQSGVNEVSVVVDHAAS